MAEGDRPDPNLNRHAENAKFESTPGIRRRVMTRERLMNYAMAQLGFPQVTVEIDPIQEGVLFEMLLDEYNRWLPLEKHDVVETVSSGQNFYNLNDLNRPYGRGITEVRVVSKENFFSPISGVFALGIPHPISHLSPDQYDLALRYIFTAKKVYSSEPDWLWEEPVLWLYAPTGFGGPFTAAYSYSQDAIDTQDIPQEDWSWCMRFFYNLVKLAVGEARGKFGTIPGPAGQELRGVDLAKEASEALDKLSEEIESKSYARVPPLGPNSI